MPPTYAQALDQIQQLQQENQALREKIELLQKTQANHDWWVTYGREMEYQNTRLREALKQCEKDFSILLTRGDFADEDIPRVTRTRDAARAALAPQEGKQE